MKDEEAFYQIRLSGDTLKRAERRAAELGMTMNEWIKHLLEQAAKEPDLAGQNG